MLLSASSERRRNREKGRKREKGRTLNQVREEFDPSETVGEGRVALHVKSIEVCDLGGVELDDESGDVVHHAVGKQRVSERRREGVEAERRTGTNRLERRRDQ